METFTTEHVQPTISKIKSNSIIPAYSTNGEGFNVDLKLETTTSKTLRITTVGYLSHSLGKLFLRAIEIVSSLNSSWKGLSLTIVLMVAISISHANVCEEVSGSVTCGKGTVSGLSGNGSVSLIQCTINQEANIKGFLKASSTKFESSLDIYSNSLRLINSKVNNNLLIHHKDNRAQEVYLDNNSEVDGDVIFDDAQGIIHVRGGSKIVGKVIGGKIMNG